MAPNAPDSLTTAMQGRAQVALSFYGDSRSTGDVANRELRALVLRHECEINPPIDSTADHNIRAVTLTEWFPGVPRIQLLDHDVEDVEEPEIRPKRSFFTRRKKDRKAEASPVEAVEEADPTPDTAETVEAPPVEDAEKENPTPDTTETVEAPQTT